MNSESDIYEAIYCADDDESRVNCEFCGELFIAIYYKNHLKSGTHINNFHQRQQLIKTNILNYSFFY